MQKTSRANFLYRLSSGSDKKTLMIWDQNRGNMSVTNDIENVVADIASHEGVEAREYLIVYRDSEGNWDGWDPRSEDFYPLSDDLLSNIDFRLGSTKSL